MYELHGSFTHNGYNGEPERFTDCWTEDRLSREIVTGDDGTLYIDQYDGFDLPRGQETPHDELLIAVDGRLHDVSSAVRERTARSVPTATPSTVVAAAYRALGWLFPQALVGDYRFLIIDQARRRFIAGRDRTVSEAVYWTVTEGTTLVSTDLVALAHEINASVNAAYLGEYLTGDIESPYATFYTDIYRIPPGCVLVSSDETTHIERYYRPCPDTTVYQQLSRDDLGDILREILAEAVACRTQPTDSTGVFMSGGADSTALACLVAQQEPQPPLSTYSYLFPNTED